MPKTMPKTMPPAKLSPGGELIVHPAQRAMLRGMLGPGRLSPLERAIAKQAKDRVAQSTK